MNNTAIISHCNTEKRYCKLNKFNAPLMLRQPNINVFKCGRPEGVEALRTFADKGGGV